MKIELLKEDFSVCKVIDYSLVDINNMYTFIAKTDEENSLVCQTKDVPLNITDREDHLKGFRFSGVLDFSLIGILSKISTILADNKIGIFAVSTYNTDYIFVNNEKMNDAITVLQNNGYEIVRK